MNKIITISRQYASGGREIGEKLADKLGIAFYDEKLITLAAEASGFSKDAFSKAEDKASNSLIYSIAMGFGAYGFRDFGGMPMSIDDQIYMAQSDVIRKVAKEGSCVIIGRCADYILQDYKNVVNVFVWADIGYRVKRAQDIYNISKAKAEENILKIDKKRANYYKYHSDKRWGKIDNYDISIRSDRIGIENAVDSIARYVENI